MNLLERLGKISANVKGQIDIMLQEDESAAKRVSILPFIEALGYDTSNLSEVKSEIPVGNEYVDYAIYLSSQPIILLEVKRAKRPLSEKWRKQLHDYFGGTEVHFAILSNGIEYRFYSDLKVQKSMDNIPFLSFDIRELDQKLASELETFTKSRFDPNLSRLSAKRSALYREITREFEHPSNDLAEHFLYRISSDSPSAEDMGVFREVLVDAINYRIGAQDQSDLEPGLSYDQGLVCTLNYDANANDKQEVVEIPIHGIYEGITFEATLLLDTRSNPNNSYLKSKSMIRFDGKIISVNGAELKARQSIVPSAKPIWKGWDRWQVRDKESGNLRPIRDLLDKGELRDQYLKNV